MPLLRQQGEGSMFFTGASGSLRGKANFAHFASSKAALRHLAQSLAREYGPHGVHVAHFIIDGIIGGQIAKQRFPEYLLATMARWHRMRLPMRIGLCISNIAPRGPKNSTCDHMVRTGEHCFSSRVILRPKPASWLSQPTRSGRPKFLGEHLFSDVQISGDLIFKRLFDTFVS